MKAQRLAFFENYLVGVLALREAAIADPVQAVPSWRFDHSEDLWRSDETIPHIIETSIGLIEAACPSGVRQER